MSKKLVFIDFIQKTIDKEMAIWDATPRNFNSEKHYLSDRKKYQNSIIRRIIQERDSKLEKTQKKEIETLYDIYGEDILKSGEKYPVEWMIKDEEFSQMMYRAKFFCGILNHIWENSSYSDTKHLQSKVSKKSCTIQELCKKTNRLTTRELILFTVNYTNLSLELGCSISVIKRYLHRFSEYEIIMDVGGGQGTKHPKIYAFGTWIKNPKTKNSRKPFLTKKNHLEKLRKFTATTEQKPVEINPQKAVILNIT